MKETKSRYVLSIFVIVIFFISIGSPVVSSAGQDSRLLEITIEDRETAAVEWRIPFPNEASAYLPVAHQVLKENIADVEVGIEQLFLQDVWNIQIAEDNETLVISFSLAGNYSDGFVTGKYRDLYELGEYAPVGVDVLTINIPDGKYLSSVNPGPNEMVGNELIYYNYNWIYPLEIRYADQVTATQIGEEWKLPTIETISVEDISAREQGKIGILAVPTPISNFSFGINEDSKYTIPGYGSYVGTDTVPGTNGKIAYEIANDYYKPKLYKDTGANYLIRPGDGPDYGYYRVLKGKDPYTGFDAYLIQYIMYWDYQDCFLDDHKYDYEPIFIWVQNIGEKPYRVAYDRVTTWGADWHIYDIHRTYLWTEDPPIFDGKYDLADMPSVYTQDKSYYPIGRHRYLADDDEDLWLHNISTSLPSESLKWDGTRIRLSHANCYNTFDTEFDLLEDPLEPYTLMPLDDALLKTWYTSPYTFDMDVSDPFYEVFWEGVGMPEQEITTILSTSTLNGNTLTIIADLTYTLDPYGSPVSYPLKGLHKDRFNGYFGSTPLPLSSITETSAGRYELNFDISSFTPGKTYTFNLTVNDNLNILSASDTTPVNIPEPLPDLTLSSLDITWDSSIDQITATIHNIGDVDITGNVDIDFYHGPPSNNILIGSDTVSNLLKDDANPQSASVYWADAPEGPQTVYVVIDGANLGGSGNIFESNENNNIADEDVDVSTSAVSVTSISTNPDPPELTTQTTITITIESTGSAIDSAYLYIDLAGSDKEYEGTICSHEDFPISASSTIQKTCYYSFEEGGQQYLKARLISADEGWALKSSLEKGVYVIDRSYELRAYIPSSHLPNPSSQYFYIFYYQRGGKDPLIDGIGYYFFSKLDELSGDPPADGDDLISDHGNWKDLDYDVYNSDCNESPACNLINISRNQFNNQPDGMYVFAVFEDADNDQEVDLPDERDGFSINENDDFVKYYINLHPLSPEITNPANNSEVSGIVTINASSLYNNIKDRDITRMVFQKYENGSWTDFYTDNTPEDGFSYTEDMTNVPDMTERIIRTRAFAMDGSSATSSSITVIVRSDIKPDLVVYPSGISFNPSHPSEGETVNISARVFNIGNTTAYDVGVRFYLGNPDTGGTPIGIEQTISSIDRGSNRRVSINWTSVGGSHDIFVVADPQDNIPETNETNNNASKNIVVNVPPTIPTSLTPTSGIHSGGSLVNIVCSGSMDLNGDSVYYNILGYYNSSWHDLELNGDGIYNWDVSSIASQTGVDLKCNATDLTDSSAYFNSAGTLEIDTTPPTITITSPQNTTYKINSTDLNYTVYDLNGIDWVGYSLDGASNITLTGNSILTNMSDGPHNITLYANDTVGNLGSKTVFFTINSKDTEVYIATLLPQTSLKPGDTLSTLIYLDNEGEIDDILTISIKGPSGTGVYQEKKYIYIEDDEGRFIRFSWPVPSDAEEGKYRLITGLDETDSISSLKTFVINNTTTPPSNLTTFNITLLEGWNLISLPLAPENTSLDVVLASIEDNYTVVYAWIGGAWKKSTATRNPLTDMTPEYGYWIDMTVPDTLELVGTLSASTTINVSTGWNLVGYPSLTNRNLTDVLSRINYSVVYAWIDGAWKKSTATRNPLTEMNPGYGYWIDTNETGSYEVRN